MSSVLDRDALEQSPLADLHVIANELGVDGFRRLRKADLIDAIIAQPVRRRGARPSRRARRRRSPSRAAARRAKAAPVADPDVETEAEAAAEAEAEEDGATDEDAPARARRGRRGGRGRGRREDGDDGGRDRDRDRDRGDRERGGDRDARGDEDRVAEGVVELLGNGSAFIRLGAGRRDHRRRRLRLRRAGQALRARHRRQDRRPGARAAPLRALPVARPRRHDQRPPGRRGRRGHEVRRPAGDLARPSAWRSAPRT